MIQEKDQKNQIVFLVGNKCDLDGKVVTRDACKVEIISLIENKVTSEGCFIK